MRKASVVFMLALVAGLAGCASVELVSSGTRSIIVGGPLDKMDEMLRVAETECQKQGLHAEFAGRVALTSYSFSCVR